MIDIKIFWWFPIATVCAGAAAIYLLSFISEAVKGWRDGRREVRQRLLEQSVFHRGRARGAEEVAEGVRRFRTTIDPPRPFPPPPGVIIEHIGCEHEDAKALQRDVSRHGLTETKWCRDCGALYEFTRAGQYSSTPKWTAPRKPEQKW